MRVLLFAVPALAIALPAAAQDRAPPPPREQAMADALANPFVQDVIANALVNVADTVLATRVGPLARYSDDVRPGDTLGDIERRRDPQYRERLRDGARRSVQVAGAVAQDSVAMAGELRATADRLRAALAPLAAAARSAYGDDLDR